MTGTCPLHHGVTLPCGRCDVTQARHALAARTRTAEPEPDPVRARALHRARTERTPREDQP